MASPMPAATNARTARARSESDANLLHEIVEHLRDGQAGLCREWVRRIRAAGLLRRMSEHEIGVESRSVYASYVHALQTGTVRTLRAHARDLSERIIPRGVETAEVIELVLLLRDVIARSLFARYGGDLELLNRVLDQYEPAADRIANTVAVGFLQERDRIRDANLALRRINERLEEEVRRIAQALHEEAGPLLVSIHLSLKELARDIPAHATRHLAEARNRLDQVEDRLRHLSHELRPPMLDDMGLVPALRFLGEALAVRSPLEVVVQDRLPSRLSTVVETTIYRIVQEALSNVVRHARARRARVVLAIEHAMVHCEIRDDGIGMRRASQQAGGRRGLGLTGMRERVLALGGTLHISAPRGGGTRLVVRIPLGGAPQ